MPRPVSVLLTGALVVAACGDITGNDAPEPITGLPRSLTVAERGVIDGSNAFAFGLLREVRAAAPGQANTFLSPLSASMALGMTMNGAAGETWTQMRDVLGFEGLEEPQVNEAYRSLIELLLTLDPSLEFGLGNAIWAQHGTALRPDFVERAETYFQATVGNLDFGDPSSADVMNAWVDSVTRGRIPELLAPEDLTANHILFLVNAIYFNADWRWVFDKANTRRAPFTRADGSEVMVDMMSDHVGYRAINVDGVEGVELPYGGGAYTAVALLPPRETSIDAFVDSLDQEAWSAWMDAFDRAADTEPEAGGGLLVDLPKFELEWGGSLIPALQALGMTDAFVGGVADLSRFSEPTGVRFVSNVEQKTFVELDEEGTEAAAATAVGVVELSGPPTVSFDRPFLFAIRERYSGTVLFLGVIGDPR